MRRSWWALGALVLALGFWLTPRGLSLYHQERGGRLLDEALAVEGHDGARESRPLLWEPLTTEEARSLAEQAAARFRAAVETDKANSQACRWLGRAALLLDDPEGAVEAFSAYARLRPKNPLGWWELGLAYERLARRVEGAVEAEFAPKLDEGSDLATIDAVPPMTVPLSTAAIETPGVAFDTPYCGQGEMPESCFVALAEWEMPDAPFDTAHGKAEGQPGWWLPEEPVRRAVLFMHPPSRATFTVTLPMTPTALTFWMGIEPTVWPWLGDGVVYRVWVDGEEVFEHTLTPEAAREGWWPGKVDLFLPPPGGGIEGGSGRCA